MPLIGLGMWLVAYTERKQAAKTRSRARELVSIAAYPKISPLRRLLIRSPGDEASFALSISLIQQLVGRNLVLLTDSLHAKSC